MKEDNFSRMESDEKQMSAVGRTIAILETLSRTSHSNLETLAKETGLPKATLLRFLSSLCSLGYVYRDDADRYQLTLKMFSVGSQSLSQIDLISVAHPFLKELSNKLGETVHMGICEGDEAIYILKEESKYNIRMHSFVGKAIPLYCTAIGKIFLSAMEEEALDNYLKTHKLKAFTPKTIRSTEAFREELRLIKARDYAVDDEENELNVMCIASPIRNYTGAVIAALSVSWPTFRFERDQFEESVELIKKTANEISKILGY